MAKRLLVIEDEPDVRDVIALVLRRAGYEVEAVADGSEGLAQALSTLPDAIILDLMIPGLHGFEVIQHLRDDETTAEIPIIVLSAKPYPADQRKALNMGANIFISKPFDPRELLDIVQKELVRTTVTFWGVRGSIAVPGPETLHYGGNTPCVSIEHDGQMLILDAGTGIRRLGLKLQRAARGESLDVRLLISHTHWDHIQGFPFFVPALVPGNVVNIYGPPSVEKPLEKVLKGQMDPQYFPVALGDMAAGIEVTELRGAPVEFGPFKVEYGYVNHPGVTLGYRIEVGGQTVVYAPDNEPYRHLMREMNGCQKAEEYGRNRDAGLGKLLDDASLAICDSQYTPGDYGQKMGWGHSCYLDTVDVAIAANVKRLALFSHDPMHDDAAVDEKLAICKDHAAKQESDIEIIASREGETIRLMDD